MRNIYYALAVTVTTWIACHSPVSEKIDQPDDVFSSFENRFLDQYWKEYPAASILIGYGKYYETMVIPDSEAIAGQVIFSNRWLDSLSLLHFDGLNANNKISFKIIRNQLESDIWYMTVFKNQEWDPSAYNMSGECYYLINQSSAPLEERLRILSKRLQHADLFYAAAFKMLKQPMREYTELGISQNLGGLSVFGKDLSDSIKASHLSPDEVKTLNEHITRTVLAMNGYVDSLKGILANKNYSFRNFRIGKELYGDKFKFDLAINLSPEELYAKALADKKKITARMFINASSLWSKYYHREVPPKDSTALVQSVINAISLEHAKPENFFDSLRNLVYELKRFIIKKDLFDFDTTYPIVVRIMPSYESGVTIASAEFTPPYQKKGETYFNIEDLTKFSKEKAESTLKEYNNYMSQLLSIHEAMPGHCLQGIYNNLKSSDVVRSVFHNGAMVEGWAVYTETMMLENGWRGNLPEMQLILDKFKLRELGNVVIDYEIQCLNTPKEDIIHFLVKECFQTEAQAVEKYHRATVSQVQLCSYFGGASAILALREEYKSKMGDKYTLKDFHENFLKYGSSPVKYIRESMLK